MNRIWIIALPMAIISCKSEPKGDRLDLKIEPEPESIEDEIIFDDIYEDDTTGIIDFAEEEPQFPGGESAMQEFIRDNIEYPQLAVKNGEQGIVYVQFVVNKDGSIENPQVMRGASPSLDKEAVRVIEKMPNWNPGKQDGENVRVRFTLPIHFRLG